jgi:hypothetical protein
MSERLGLRGVWAAVVITTLGVVSTALAQQTPVEITSQRENADQMYRLTVHNRGDKPIKRIEFSHFNVDSWKAPEGWAADGTSIAGKPGVGDNEGGTLWADADAGHALGRGRSAEFVMRINNLGAKRGSGPVTVTFDDGTKIIVEGVDLPRPPTVVDQYGTPFILGSVLVVILALRALRRKRRPESDGSGASP